MAPGISIQGNILVAKVLDKKLNSNAAMELKQCLQQHINKDFNFVVINISEVEFIDGVGLNHIVSTKESLGDSYKFVITGVSETVMAVFKLTRCDKLFEFFNTEEQAIKILAN
jgi:anti-anti-sigma factor